VKVFGNADQDSPSCLSQAELRSAAVGVHTRMGKTTAEVIMSQQLLMEDERGK